MGAMLARVIRAMVRRATAGDLFALEELRRMQGLVDRALADAALGAHDGPAHYSWSDIGRELGMTKQAAHQLYGGGGTPGDG